MRVREEREEREEKEIIFINLTIASMPHQKVKVSIVFQCNMFISFIEGSMFKEDIDLFRELLLME